LGTKMDSAVTESKEEKAKPSKKQTKDVKK